jgi:hypothetical protein
MVTLDPNSGHLVLINTFTVDPAKAEALFSALSQAKSSKSGLALLCTQC